MLISISVMEAVLGEARYRSLAAPPVLLNKIELTVEFRVEITDVSARFDKLFQM